MNALLKRRRRVLGGSFVLAIVLALVSLSAGPTGWNNARASVIFWEIRLPAALAAILVGGSLSITGLLMQSMFRNPLAGPDVMGVSAGASLGVALLFLAGIGGGFGGLVGDLGSIAVFAASATGAFTILLCALAVARRFDDSLAILVMGLMFGAFAMGIVGFFVAFARPDELQDYIRWTLGSFDLTWRSLLPFSVATAVGLAGAVASTKAMNALPLAADESESLGLARRSARIRVLMVSALLSGSATAACGPIGFIGVAAPHLSRLALRSADHRWLLPTSWCVGSAFGSLILCVSKMLAGPISLPINSVSGVLGAPIIIWLIARSRVRS